MQNPSLETIISKFKPVHILTTYLTKIHVNPWPHHLNAMYPEPVTPVNLNTL